MTTDRKIIIGLIILLAVLGISFFSRSNPHQEIKKITQQMKVKVDSLHLLQTQYDSLRVRYDSIYSQLYATRGLLVDYKNDVDSIMGSNIRTVGELERALEGLLEKQKDYAEVVPDDNTDLRF